MVTPGFAFSQLVICSSRKLIAPACSFVKNVLTPVILSGEEAVFPAGAFAVGLTAGPAGPADAFVVPAPP